MKIAVLGANGYLGKFLVNSLLADNYNVLPVTRETLILTNYSEVNRWLEVNKPNVVINCATAVSITDVRDNKINYDDLRNNINIFLNFYNNDNLFDRFINIGSGAEFDKSIDITNAQESDILTSQPIESYGYSKNLISRLVLEKDKFCTLRLFGCFGSTESSIRLFPQLKTKSLINIEDRQFDYFSVRDFYNVIRHYLNNKIIYKDINCVYKEKYWLREIVEIFKHHHNLPAVITVTSTGKNYTGNGDRLSYLNLKLNGLEKSIKEYE